MKIRRIVSLLLCCITIAAMFSLAACGDKGNYVDAFNAYMTAEDNLDTDAIIDLLPPDMYNYMYNHYKKIAEERGEDASDDKIKETVAMRYRPKILSFDMAKLDKDTDLVNDFTYSYKIEDTYNASSSEIKEFNNYVKNKLGFNTKAQDIVLIKYRFTIKNKGEVFQSFDNVVSFGICIKMGGKWYYAEGSMSNEKMWVDRSGLEIYDCVQWINDWF